ncbi:MAG: hypothetical protein PHT51_01625 [Patescibacteria group bacterium]|nr:hypothetical protein [Patescibacteria group bacterium]MDD4611088.1 hypothetical protein [Patescibacteria group bacterium]
MDDLTITMTGAEKEKTFDQTLSELPDSVKQLIPDNNLGYYKKTSEMHCDTKKPGGSKFTEIGNILEVLKKDAPKIDTGVEKRTDDREALLAVGASERAFLPATKTPGQPEGLPEALYFKVDGFKGKLGIIQLKDLDPNTKIIIRREKSVIDEKTGKEKVPCSFSVVKETVEDMPDVDFATVIIGREGGENGNNELWTIHPGAPIKSSEGDFIAGSETLSGPKEGEKQKVIIITAGELLKTEKMTENDYVKIINGKENDIIDQYEKI